MSATITIGMMLIGAALGFGLAWYPVGGRNVETRKQLLVRAACALTGAVLVHLAITPVVKDAWATQRASAEEPGVNRQTVCAIAVTLYEKVMRLPPADAAAVIRSMTRL